ncbi:hypothetical protein GGI42DRAFT_361864 [Trichoderma sp. SZMC 28013]
MHELDVPETWRASRQHLLKVWLKLPRKYPRPLGTYDLDENLDKKDVTDAHWWNHSFPWATWAQNHDHSFSIPAVGGLDTVTRNTYTALGSLQLKTLPTTRGGKHAHHRAMPSRVTPGECNYQFLDLAMPTGCECLCFIPAPEIATSVNHLDRETAQPPRFTMMSQAANVYRDNKWFSTFPRKDALGQRYYEEISTSFSFAFTSSTFLLPAACLVRPLNPPRQPP